MNYEGAQEREVLACCVLFSFDVVKVKVCHDCVVSCVVVVVVVVVVVDRHTSASAHH